jgi:trans-aconitate methyltransferase
MDPYNQTFHTWNKLSASYQERFMDFDLYNDTYDIFCLLVEKQNATIFEIGCGPGNITRYISAKRPDFKISAIDAAPNMIDLAAKNNPGVRFSVMDCRKIDSLKSKYDGIVCGFTLPYLSKEDCKKLFKDCAALLNNGGIFYLSAIEGDYEKSHYQTSSNGEHTIFVYYHQENYLSEWLAENNFRILNLIRKNYSKNDGAVEVHMVFVLRINS